MLSFENLKCSFCDEDATEHLLVFENSEQTCVLCDTCIDALKVEVDKIRQMYLDAAATETRH
jgi:formate dehydrogenase maturation protein FdhE